MVSIGKLNIRLGVRKLRPTALLAIDPSERYASTDSREQDFRGATDYDSTDVAVRAKHPALTWGEGDFLGRTLHWDRNYLPGRGGYDG